MIWLQHAFSQTWQILFSGLLILLIINLTGCETMKVEDYANQSPTLKIEDYFQGNTWGWGIFQDRSGKVKKSFKVTMHGEYSGNTLTLNETFLNDDGTTNHRTWVINTLDNNHYQGAAGDVVGIAKGERSGNAFNWKYTLNLPVSGRNWHVNFDDWMFLQPDNIVINRATMSKWGITLGTLTFIFTKQQPASQI